MHAFVGSKPGGSRSFYQALQMPSRIMRVKTWTNGQGGLRRTIGKTGSRCEEEGEGEGQKVCAREEISKEDAEQVAP